MNERLNYFKEISLCRTFFLTKFMESKSSLILTITESTLGKASEDRSDESEFELLFESYIGFSVIDESFSYPDDNEIFEGNHLVIYQESNYLEYIKKATHANEEHPGPFVHYGVNCLSNIVDVISTQPPKIKKIR